MHFDSKMMKLGQLDNKNLIKLRSKLTIIMQEIEIVSKCYHFDRRRRKASVLSEIKMSFYNLNSQLRIVEYSF